MQRIQMPVPFYKMSGTGNDFIVIDHRQEHIAVEAMSEFARLVCRRKFSVGADGLIFIENSDSADFKWRFFNADGSIAEMCGNGARCAARFAYLQGIAPAKMRFETLAGVIEASIFDTEVSVRMTAPQAISLHKELDIGGKPLRVHSIDTGVPHVVVFVNDITQADVCGLGRYIRHHQMFMPAGTNVNFVQKKSAQTYFVRTYERGVEDETFACGTGAVATALVATLLGEASSPIEIITSGYDRLTISFDLQRDHDADNVYLKGPAHVIYQGELSAEALLMNAPKK